MVGAECCRNPPALSSTFGQGSVVDDIGGLRAYVTGSPDSKLAILLVPDLYGFEVINLRNHADKVAAAAFFVVIPDFYYGDPYDGSISIDAWTQLHGTDKGVEDAKKVIADLKSKGLSAVGAAGFCWGGKVVADLAKTDAIYAAVLLHPALVTVDDFKDTKVNIAILGAGLDTVTPPEKVKQIEEILSAKPEIDSFAKVYPGVQHGWTTRYSVDDEIAVKKSDEAWQDMLEWFEKYSSRSSVVYSYGRISFFCPNSKSEMKCNSVEWADAPFSEKGQVMMEMNQLKDFAGEVSAKEKLKLKMMEVKRDKKLAYREYKFMLFMMTMVVIFIICMMFMIF